MKTGPSNKEETKERIVKVLTESKTYIARSSLALKSQTAFYTLPKLCAELQTENKIEILQTPFATYYKIKVIEVVPVVEPIQEVQNEN